VSIIWTAASWASDLLKRKPARLVTVAVADKMARIAWAIMARQEVYRAARAVA
jgi:transposase